MPKCFYNNHTANKLKKYFCPNDFADCPKPVFSSILAIFWPLVPKCRSDEYTIVWGCVKIRARMRAEI